MNEPYYLWIVEVFYYFKRILDYNNSGGENLLAIYS